MIRSLFQRNLMQARRDPVWGVALLAALLMPWMLAFARAGIEVCGALIGLGFIWHSTRTRDWAWLRTPFAKVALLSGAWLCVVASPLGEVPLRSFLEGLAWLRFPLMFLALRDWLLREASARTLLAASIAAAVTLVMGDALYQAASGYSLLTGHAKLASGRLTGPFEHPKVVMYLGKLLLPAAALLLLSLERAASRLAVLLWVTLGLCTILLAGERSALLGALLVLGLVAGLMALRQDKLRLPVLLAGVGLLLSFALLYATNGWVQTRMGQMAETILHYPKSDYGLLAGAALDLAREHPWHGLGIYGFRALCPWLGYELGDQVLWFRGYHPHNFYLEWLIEAGVPGLLLLLAQVFTLGREGVQQFRRSIGWRGELAAAATLGLLVQHFFPLIGTQSYFANWPAMMQWLALGMLFAVLGPGKTRADGLHN